MKTLLQIISAVLLAITSSLGFAADSKASDSNTKTSSERPRITAITVQGDQAAIVGFTNDRVKIGETEFIIAKHTYTDSNQLALHLKMMSCRNVSPTENADVLAALKIKKLEPDQIVVARLPAKAAPTANPAPAPKPAANK
jgi:hypothetical protein